MKAIVYYPTDPEKKAELEKLVATAHANAVIHRLKNLPCSKEQKLKLLKQIKDAYIGMGE